MYGRRSHKKNGESSTESYVLSSPFYRMIDKLTLDTERNVRLSAC